MKSRILLVPTGAIVASGLLFCGGPAIGVVSPARVEPVIETVPVTTSPAPPKEPAAPISVIPLVQPAFSYGSKLDVDVSANQPDITITMYEWVNGAWVYRQSKHQVLVGGSVTMGGPKVYPGSKFRFTIPETHDYLATETIFTPKVAAKIETTKITGWPNYVVRDHVRTMKVARNTRSKTFVVRVSGPNRTVKLCQAFPRGEAMHGTDKVRKVYRTKRGKVTVKVSIPRGARTVWFLYVPRVKGYDDASSGLLPIKRR